MDFSPAFIFMVIHLQDKLPSCILQVDHILPIREETAHEVNIYPTHKPLSQVSLGALFFLLCISPWMPTAALPATSLPSYWSLWGVIGEVLVTFWPHRLTAVGLSYMGAISTTFLTFWCINHDCEVKFMCLWQFVLKVFEQFSTPFLCSGHVTLTTHKYSMVQMLDSSMQCMQRPPTGHLSIESCCWIIIIFN